MAYGIIYQGEFSSISEDDYRLEILRKEYTGPFSTLQLSAVPVVQNWNTDDPKAQVKGCALTINYLNKGNNPIEDFISNNDDEFKVIFYQGTQVLFVGFLVQDDIREPMLDYTHEVQLSANDGLGLLKDIALDKYPLTGQNATTAKGAFAVITNIIYLKNSQYTPSVGVPFTITGHPNPAMNGTFTPTSVAYDAPTNTYNIHHTTFTGTTIEANVLVNGVGFYFNFYGKVSLMNIIGLCLQNTGAGLNINVYENIFEAYQNTTSSSLQQTLVDIRTFIKEKDFDDCYIVLTKVLKRFGLTLFQSLGRWNVVRWDELRYGTNIFGYLYNTSVTLVGVTALDAGLTFGFEQTTYPETGLEKTILRPYQFVKETFNYVQPKYLLRNYDLMTTGSLLRTYVSGPNTVYEYFATDWTAGFTGLPLSERFIRVIKDNTDTEIDRMLVIRGATYDSPRSVAGVPFELSQGDKIKVSYSVQTNISVGGPATFICAVMLYNGVSTRYVDEVPTGNGNWITGVGFNYSILGGDNLNKIHAVEIASSQAPFSGLCTVFLPQVTPTPQNAGRETWIRDIRLEYTAYVNASTKIIGQIHNDQQDEVIKNNQSEDIFIDDSPRGSVAGTLFLNNIVALLQQRTILWHRDGITENKKLGQIITTEQLQWRSVSRIKLDGDFRGLIQSGKYICMLGHFNYTELPGLNFLFGNLQIDYRNNKFSCSAWELFKDGEADVAEDYTFTYIYDAK